MAGGASWIYHATKKHAVTQAGSSSYTYSYDANGNAITRNGYSISWSSYNYPLQINGPGKQLTFTYDANRQRIQQVYANGSTTETTTYVGKLLEKVTVGSLTDWRHYIHAGSRRVAVMSRSSTGSNVTRYILEDHQNSIAQITDNAGATFVSESFTAFGARRDAASWNGGCNCDDLVKMKSVTRKGYTGHDAIGGVSLGLNHMNGRVQDAITGRFLSPDPFITQPGSTQNYNRYSYVNNNPLSFTDPSGFTSRSSPTISYNGVRGIFDAFRERRPAGGRGFSGGGRESQNSPPTPDLGQPDGDDGDEDEEDEESESQSEEQQCGWNGEQGDWTDFAGGLLRELGNDLLRLFAYIGAASDPSTGIGDTLSVLGAEPLGSNETNLGILGAELAFIPESIAGGSTSLMVTGTALRGSNAAGTSFSHWIPNRMGGPASILNGRVVSNWRHSMHDPNYFLRGQTAADKWNPMLRQLDRVPPLYRDAAITGAVGETLGCD